MSEEGTEGELALKKRREQKTVTAESIGLDESDKELLAQNQVEREKMAEEIEELRERSEQRKKEREEEEKRLAAERAAEDARRKAEDEDRRRRKEEEEAKKHSARLQKQAEFEKWKIPQKANFVITRREHEEEEGDAEGEAAGRKSKEQLEAEKRAILKQRVKPLDIAGADSHRIVEKIRELHSLIARLEGEKYDLEHRYKVAQNQLTELAERARQANKVGDGLKRIQTATDASVDKIQTRFAGAPSKVEMYSKYERQKDKRSYDERHVLYTGPQWAHPVERINPTKVVRWNGGPADLLSIKAPVTWPPNGLRTAHDTPDVIRIFRCPSLQSLSLSLSPELSFSVLTRYFRRKYFFSRNGDDHCYVIV